MFWSQFCCCCLLFIFSAKQPTKKIQRNSITAYAFVLWSHQSTSRSLNSRNVYARKIKKNAHLKLQIGFQWISAMFHFVKQQDSNLFFNVRKITRFNMHENYLILNVSLFFLFLLSFSCKTNNLKFFELNFKCNNNFSFLCYCQKRRRTQKKTSE